jgi:hypothetical protein
MDGDDEPTTRCVMYKVKIMYGPGRISSIPEAFLPEYGVCFNVNTTMYAELNAFCKAESRATADEAVVETQVPVSFARQLKALADANEAVKTLKTKEMTSLAQKHLRGHVVP